MVGNDSRASPGGLSIWPRRLFLGAAALAVAVLGGLWVYGLAIDKAVSPNAAGTLVLGIVTADPSSVFAWRAIAGEANPRRTAGIWIALLSYLGVVAGLVLMLIGDALWLADRGTTIILNDPVQPGLSTHLRAVSLWQAMSSPCRRS